MKIIKKCVNIFEIHMLKSLPANFIKYFLDYSFKKAKNSEKGLFYNVFLTVFILFSEK